MVKNIDTDKFIGNPKDIAETIWSNLLESKIKQRDRNIEIENKIAEANPEWKKFRDRAWANPNEQSNRMIDRMCEAMQ